MPITRRLRSPITYVGGKGNMVAKLLPIVTAWRHHTYCEPFGGGASLLLAKPPVGVEVYNDLDGEVVNFFKVLADEVLFSRFYRRVALLPYSRELYYEYLGTWNKIDDPVERAARWFVAARQVFGGKGGQGGWGFVVSSSGRGMARTCSDWLSALEGLPEVYRRLIRVQIEHQDFRKVLEHYDTEETLFYCDPPFVLGTRGNRRYYSCEMDDTSHAELVASLLSIEGAAVVSGYAHPIYEPLEKAGWVRIDWKTASHIAGRTRGTGILGSGAAKMRVPRIESVWIHPKVAEAYRLQSSFDLVWA